MSKNYLEIQDKTYLEIQEGFERRVYEFKEPKQAELTAEKIKKQFDEENVTNYRIVVYQRINRSLSIVLIEY